MIDRLRGRWAEVLGEDFFPESDTQRAVEAVRKMFNEYPIEAEDMLHEFIDTCSYPRLFTAAAVLFFSHARHAGHAPRWLLGRAGVLILEPDQKVAEKERKLRTRDEKHQVRWMAVSILMYGPPRRRERALHVLAATCAVTPTWTEDASGNVYGLVAELLIGHPAAGAANAIRASYKQVAKVYRGQNMRLLATAAIRELR